MVDKLRATVKRGLLCAIVLSVALVAYGVVLPTRAHALEITQRSLHINDVNPGATTQHTFSFSYATSQPVGSIVFEYCDSPLEDVPCVAPPGVNASGATLSNQVGENNYFLLSAQMNKLTLTRAPAILPTHNPSSYTFSGVVNPTGTPATFYVRITTFVDTGAAGPPLDFGSVANATTQAIYLSTQVPPILKFCVGITLGVDCTAADDNLIDLGDLSTTKAAFGSSQMLAATNAEFGLNVAMYGTTMTSGNNIIPALTNPTVSAPGNAQFGLNLRDNSDPNIGQDPTGVGISNPTARYNQANKYTFANGDTIATSPAATDTRKFTSSYIVNVPPSQAPGVYTATITYVCTASF